MRDGNASSLFWERYPLGGLLGLPLSGFGRGGGGIKWKPDCKSRPDRAGMNLGARSAPGQRRRNRVDVPIRIYPLPFPTRATMKAPSLPAGSLEHPEGARWVVAGMVRSCRSDLPDGCAGSGG